ncbi:7278_t:CDS:1, partial [Scutellospora calospora]
RDNYSIAWDYFETEETEKGFFNVCRLCKEKNITIKYVHNSSTRNMLGYLWSKHRIDKDHSDRMNTDSTIVKAMHIITKRRQKRLAQDLVEFIIENCQPLNILHCQSFRRFLNDLEPGFRIPCKITTKKMINQAYDWSHDQLFGMMNVDGESINLTTDLWSLRTNKGYIRVIAT